MISALIFQFCDFASVIFSAWVTPTCIYQNFFKSHLQPLPSGSVSWNIVYTPSSSPVRLHIAGNHSMFLSDQYFSLSFPLPLSLKTVNMFRKLKKIISIMIVEFFPQEERVASSSVSTVLANAAVLGFMRCCH